MIYSEELILLITMNNKCHYKEVRIRLTLPFKNFNCNGIVGVN